MGTNRGPRDWNQAEMEGYLRSNPAPGRQPCDPNVHGHQTNQDPWGSTWVREEGYGGPAFGGAIIGIIQLAVAAVALVVYGLRKLVR